MTALPGLIMTCDAPCCFRWVSHAPRIVVPPRAECPSIRPLRIMTTLHYCDTHRDYFDVQRYLSATQKRRIERQARELFGPDWRPDFEAARVEHVLVTTPEYRAFLEHIGTQLYVTQ
jgi:hypothetical protein